MAIGSSIREARRQRGLTQMELAERVGVSQTMISYWERGNGTPAPYLRERMELVLGALDEVAASLAATDEEEVEGFEASVDSSLGEYPIDSVMIRHETRTVHDVIRRIEKGQFILDPDFQRAFIWDSERQSRLIESVLMRIPLPVLYLAETPDGKMVVVDGLQRLTTFQHFVDNKLRLDLQNPELKRKRFGELDVRLQTRIEDTNLILYVIDSKVPERVRLDIFERVNGGVPLTRQQMRNCLYNGPGTRFVRECADLASFGDLFSPAARGVMRRTMRDRELVNRFAAFRVLGWAAYRGDMDLFLGEALRSVNALCDGERAGLFKEFEAGIENNNLLFERQAFRRHDSGDARRGKLNVALFDVLCTQLGRYSTEGVSGAQSQLRAALHTLMADPLFTSAITQGTNQTDKVRVRFSLVERVLTDVLGAP